MTNAGFVALPEQPKWLEDALAAEGLSLVDAPETAEGLIWLGNASGLADALERCPNVRFVQLPWAGVDDYFAADVLRQGITWCSAKGANSEPVAEHALALILSGLRRLHLHARATSWGDLPAVSLFEKKVLIVGAGGLAAALAHLLEPFRSEITVVRRQMADVPWAYRTLPVGALDEALPDQDVVVLAAAKTAETTALIGREQLTAMRPDSVLVNVARGALVDHDALASLADGEGPAVAALDVTDPEPLPEDSPLWRDPRIFITPHSADPWPMTRPHLTRRIVANMRNFDAGAPFEGIVDLENGY